MRKLDGAIRIDFKVVYRFQSLSRPAWVNCHKEFVSRSYSIEFYPSGNGDGSTWFRLKFCTIKLDNSVFKLGSRDTVTSICNERYIVLNGSLVFMLRIIIDNDVPRYIGKAIMQRRFARLFLIYKASNQTLLLRM